MAPFFVVSSMVIFKPEHHWALAMQLRRQALAAPDDASRNKLERLAGSNRGGKWRSTT
jgi:hypothetical protein